MEGKILSLDSSIRLPNLAHDHTHPIPVLCLVSISVFFSHECTPNCQPIVDVFPTVFISPFMIFFLKVKKREIMNSKRTARASASECEQQ